MRGDRQRGGTFEALDGLFMPWEWRPARDTDGTGCRWDARHLTRSGMNRLAIAPMLVAGPGRMVIEEGYSLRVEGPGTDVPEQHGNGGDHDTPSNNACRAKRHVRQSTGRSPALSM